jgi:hypothetical protein
MRLKLVALHKCLARSARFAKAPQGAGDWRLETGDLNWNKFFSPKLKQLRLHGIKISRANRNSNFIQ